MLLQLDFMRRLSKPIISNYNIPNSGMLKQTITSLVIGTDYSVAPLKMDCDVATLLAMTGGGAVNGLAAQLEQQMDCDVAMLLAMTGGGATNNMDCDVAMLLAMTGWA